MLSPLQFTLSNHEPHFAARSYDMIKFSPDYTSVIVSHKTRELISGGPTRFHSSLHMNATGVHKTEPHLDFRHRLLSQNDPASPPFPVETEETFISSSLTHPISFSSDDIKSIPISYLTIWRGKPYCEMLLQLTISHKPPCQPPSPPSTITVSAKHAAL